MPPVQVVSNAAAGNNIDLGFWENFVESIALVLSRGLTDSETEKVVQSWNSFQSRLKRLSAENLARVEAESIKIRPYCKHRGFSCSQNAFRAFFKSFIVVYCVKYGLGFVPSLLMGQIFKDPSLILRLGGRDTVRFTLFLSCFTTVFKGVLCAMRRIRQANDWKNAAIAGFISGTTLLLDDNKTRRVMVALYLSTRGLHFIGRYVWRHYLELNWDPHARAREAIEKEHQRLSDSGGVATTPLGDGTVQRDMGRLRGNSITINLPAKKQILDIRDDDDEDKEYFDADYYYSRGNINNFKKKQEKNEKDDYIYDDSGIKEPLHHRPTTAKSPREGVLSLSSPTKPPIQHLELSPPEKQKVSAVKKFLRQSSAVMVMMLSSSQILYAYICEPESLARSYFAFLTVHGGVKDRFGKKHSVDHLKLLGEIVKSAQDGNSTKFVAKPLDINSPIPFEENIPHGHDINSFSPFKELMTSNRHEYLLCSLIHPEHMNCLSGSISSFKAEWWRALTLYTPLNAIMGVLFKGHIFLQEPVRFSKHIVKSILRSSMFLSCYCTSAWLVPCTLRNIFKKDQRWMYYVNGLVSGMCVLLEAPGRRLELALYCAPRGIESLWNCMVKYGKVKHINNGELIYFCVAMSFVMTLYQHDPESIDDGYRKVMVRFLGVN